MAEATQIDRERIRKEGFPEAVPLSEKLINSLSEEQRQILFTLTDLAEEEQKLVDEINARRPTPSGILQIGGAITVCEDEDDWRVITMGLRQERRKVKEKIATNLNKALDSGLGFLGIIQRQCVNYDVKP